MSDRSSRLIVLTGCSRGLGLALTHEFDRQGHTVIGCGRNPTALGELRRTLPSRHHFSQVDVTDQVAVEGWARVVLHELGPPDFLLNNAGVINDPSPLWEVAADEIATLFEVNVLGTTHVLRAFLPAMRARSTGVVVNFSSGAGRMGLPGIAPYCATKWAIEGLTRSLAEELPEGMAAVPLSPGPVNTDMLRQIWGERAGQEVAPDAWARLAVPFILGLGPQDNGEPLTVPRA